MINSFHRAEDLESEMTVVRNEWERSENSPGRVLQQRVMSAAYDWHNYGNTTIGARADIEQVPIERLQAFYRKYYQPDNAVLVVAGRFDTDHALDVIVDKFGSIPRPDRTGANQLFPTYTAEPAQDGERSVTLRRVGDVQLALAMYHVPPGSHEDFPAVQVMAHVLSTQPAGRLYKALVEPGLAAGTSAFAYQLKEPGMFSARWAAGAPGGFAGRLAAERLFRHAARDGGKRRRPRKKWTARRTDFLSGIRTRFQQPAGNCPGFDASGRRWATGRCLFPALGDLLENVRYSTPKDVATPRRQAISQGTRTGTVGLLLSRRRDSGESRNSAPPDVRPWWMGTSVAGGDSPRATAFDPTPANIEARTQKVTLPIGLQVALLYRKEKPGPMRVERQFPVSPWQ